MNAELGQFSGSGRTDIEQVADRQPPSCLAEVVRRNDGGGVRLLHIRTQFGKDLVVGHAYRYRQAKFMPDAGADVVCDSHTISEQAGRAGHVQPALVQAKGFHLVGIVDVNIPCKRREVKVSLIVGGNADQLRTLLAGLPEHLAGSDAELLGKVIFCQDDAMAGFFIASYSYRFVFQGRIIKDFYAGIEIVHVRMQNDRFHRSSMCKGRSEDSAYENSGALKIRYFQWESSFRPVSNARRAARGQITR